MKNKQLLILASLIITLLLGVIGGTYAWFQANITNDVNNKNITVMTGQLGITYTNGNEIKVITFYQDGAKKRHLL